MSQESIVTTEIIGVLVSALVSFLVAWSTVRAEERKGRAALYILCCRFFISAFNTIDPISNSIKQDNLSKTQYMEELDAILKELSNLSSNPLFIKFVARNEFVPQMLVQLRRELIEHNATNEFAFNPGSIEHFIATFDWCKKWPWGFWLKKHNNTQELVSYFRQR